jgi:hypothetical protein
MSRVRFRRGLRLLAIAMAVAMGMLGLGLGGAPASALNHDSYNILRNAGSHQYCLDIRTEDQPVGARAHLWTCTHPVVGEQQFLLVTVPFVPTLAAIKVQRSGYCLEKDDDGPIRQRPCVTNGSVQAWDLRDTGEIVNFGSGLCLDAVPADTKGADVVARPCDGSISQRWFF